MTDARYTDKALVVVDTVKNSMITNADSENTFRVFDRFLSVGARFIT